MKTHTHWLLKTLSLAQKREGFCAPNPSVGAVVVKNDQLIAEGYHFGAGHPHAEVMALNQIGGDAKGADLYVSLEPCCHYGRTPPCTGKIIASGIARVFFAFLDPNPRVAGKGMQALIEAGIACEQIILPEINDFYAPYAYWTLNQRPFVTAKIAVTADGYVANQDGTPLAITGHACQLLTHTWRLKSDALLSTTQTIIADDPQLNIRLDNQTVQKPLYLLDTKARLPFSARVFQTTQSITLFHGQQADQEKLKRLSERGVRCIEIAELNDNLDLNQVLKHIGQDGMHTVWVEAGPTCFAAFSKQKLMQRMLYYQSDKVLSRPGTSLNMDRIELLAHASKHEYFGTDVVYFVVY